MTPSVPPSDESCLQQRKSMINNQMNRIHSKYIGWFSLALNDACQWYWSLSYWKRDLVTDYWYCRFPVILALYCSNSPFKNLQIQQKKTIPTEGRHIVVQEMFSTFGDQTEPSNVTLTLYLKQPFLAKGEFWSQIAPRLSLRPICCRLSCQNWDKENTTCILNSWYCILLKMIWLTIFEVLEVGTSQSELTTKVDFRLFFEKQGFYARNKM